MSLSVLLKTLVSSVLAVTLAACGSMGSKKQPLLTENQESARRFSDATQFPYRSEAGRAEMIRKTAGAIQPGMTGQDILGIMGAPDETEVLSFPFGSVRGWAWDYDIYKVYRDAPNDDDVYLQLIFDVDGKVSKIVRKNLSDD